MEREVRFHPIPSLLLSVMATTGLHAYLHVQDEGHGPRVHLTEEQVYTGTNVERFTAGERYRDTREITEEVPGGFEETPRETLHYATAPYAKKFAEDEAALEIDQPAADGLQGLVEQLINDGAKEVKLRIYGNSSAEDDSTSDDGGLMSESAANSELADKRRDVFINYVSENSEIENIATIEPAYGVEHNLNSEQYDELETYAEQFGYATVREMVDSWNDDGDVPPIVESTLDAWLKEKRGVTVEVYARFVEKTEPTTEKSYEFICAVPVKEVTTKMYELEPWKATFPWLIPVPVFTFPRRRRENDNTSDPYGLPTSDYKPPSNPAAAGDSETIVCDMPDNLLSDDQTIAIDSDGEAEVIPPNPGTATPPNNPWRDLGYPRKPLPPRAPWRPHIPRPHIFRGPIARPWDSPYWPERLRIGSAVAGGIAIGGLMIWGISSCWPGPPSFDLPPGTEFTPPPDPCEGLEEVEVVVEREERKTIAGLPVFD